MRIGQSVFVFFLQIFLFIPMFTFAQEGDNQYFTVHQEQIIPGKEQQYETAMKDMIAEMKTAKIKAKWIAVTNEDGIVRYLQPITSMCDLDNSFYSEMYEKMGDDKVNSFFEAFSGSYKDMTDYVMALRTDLSYQPSGINQLPEGEYYRNNTYYYPNRGSTNEFIQKANEIKALFKQKNVTLNYRVYQSGYGVQDSFLMVTVAAKNVGEYHENIAKLSNKLGADFQKLLTEIRQLCDKIEVEHSTVRLDLSYGL